MKFIAKGALKSKRRFKGGVLDPCSYVELEYRESRGVFHKIKQAWFLKDFRGLRQDYARLELSFYIMKTIRACSLEGANDFKELFHLTGNTLGEIETTSRLAVLKLFFQVKLLYLQGVLPSHSSYLEIVNKKISDHKDYKIDDKEEARLYSQANQLIDKYLFH